MYSVLWNQLWLSFSVNAEIWSFSEKSKFEGEECLFFSKMNTFWFFFLFLLFVLTEMYSFRRYGNFPYEKYMRFWKKQTIVVLQGKRLWIVGCLVVVFYRINDKNLWNKCFYLFHWYFFISTMICFASDGKNDRYRMVLMFWNTLNVEIDCSVMRLSCLDELLNNDILLSLSFAWYV